MPVTITFGLKQTDVLNRKYLREDAPVGLGEVLTLPCETSDQHIVAVGRAIHDYYTWRPYWSISHRTGAWELYANNGTVRFCFTCRCSKCVDRQNMNAIINLYRCDTFSIPIKLVWRAYNEFYSYWNNTHLGKKGRPFSSYSCLEDVPESKHNALRMQVRAMARELQYLDRALPNCIGHMNETDLRHFMRNKINDCKELLSSFCPMDV